MKKINLLLLFLALPCLNINAAHSSVLTFDDVTTDTWDAIPNGYGGLNWTNFWVIAPHLDSSLDGSSGWQNGLFSGDFLAYNQAGAPAEVSSGTAFDFVGVNMNAAYRDGLLVTATGLRNGTPLFQETIEVNTDLAQYFAFNFIGIDTLQFVSQGGIAPEAWDGTHFNIDNFAYNAAPVPVPAAVWLFGSSIIGFAGLCAAYPFDVAASRGCTQAGILPLPRQRNRVATPTRSL